MRGAPALLLVLLALLAGCTLPGPAPAEDVLLVAEAFEHVEAPWVAQVTGGCGQCLGRPGFGPHAEHHALYVFGDARVVLLEWNVVPGEPNAPRIHESVTFDPAQASGLLRDSPRGQSGEPWLVRLYTARATDADLPARLAASWRTGAEDSPCWDAGVSYLLRHANGTIEREDFSCGAGEPLLAFARAIDALAEETRARGALQGAPPS